MSSILDMAAFADDDSQEMSSLRKEAPVFVPSSQRMPTPDREDDAHARSTSYNSPALASMEGYIEGYVEGYSSDEGHSQWVPNLTMPGALDMNQAMWTQDSWAQQQYYPDHPVSWQTAQYLEVEEQLRANLYQVPSQPMGNTYGRARRQRAWGH